MDILLKIEQSKCEESVYSENEPYVYNEYDLPAKVGRVCPTWDCEITEVSPTEIRIQNGDEIQILQPGDCVFFSKEIDGDEWSDGCVYDSTTYILKISWPTKE